MAESGNTGWGECREHHARGVARVLHEDRRPLASALGRDDGSDLSARERAVCAYAARLTNDPASIEHADIESLREAGLTDREILDVAQASAYFAYANRIVLGLGAELESEDALGQWPEE